MPCIIVSVMMMVMIIDNSEITIVALDGCHKFFKKRRTYKKKESSAFLKCNSTVYCCAYMYSIEYVFFLEYTSVFVTVDLYIARCSRTFQNF